MQASCLNISHPMHRGGGGLTSIDPSDFGVYTTDAFVIFLLRP